MMFNLHWEEKGKWRLLLQQNLVHIFISFNIILFVHRKLIFFPPLLCFLFSKLFPTEPDSLESLLSTWQHCQCDENTELILFHPFNF
uniref:Putative ovule protein n=1 Tax=Solanum chacoense TaxID=4108 RepID=A0A0V0GX77_SOLCH